MEMQKHHQVVLAMLALLAVVLVMHGTATKLQTARNINLQGAVSGNANFDGSGNVTINTTQANVAKIEGKITASQTGIMQNTNIAYPSGFNKDNCIVLTAMLSMEKDTEVVREWGYGNVFNSGSYVRGSLPVSVGLMQDKILISFRNIIISGESITEVDFQTDFYYKIILMKI